jgi:hypothetical protein
MNFMFKKVWVLGAMSCMVTSGVVAAESYDAESFRLPTQHIKAAPVDVNFWMVRDAPTQPLEAYPGVQAGPEKWKDLKAKPVVVAKKPDPVKPDGKEAAASPSLFSGLMNFFKGEGEQKTKSEKTEAKPAIKPVAPPAPNPSPVVKSPVFAPVAAENKVMANQLPIAPAPALKPAMLPASPTMVPAIIKPAPAKISDDFEELK